MVLVTDGAGFLGSHLCDRLIERGERVICIDNLLTGSERNIEHLRREPRFEFMLHDVTVPLQLKVDRIFNLACPASPVHYQSDPVQTMKTNVLGAINVLELARQVGARVLQASTSEVYGDPEVHPQVEGYWGHVNPIGPRSCYDEGKRCAEALFFSYQRQHSVDIKVVRIFNTYGPRMHVKGGVVSRFIVQALRGEDITVYGDGTQTRSFCYVDDLVEGMLRMMDSDEGFAGPVNLGNPREITMNELAEKVLAITGARSRIRHEPLPADDPKQRRPEVRLAKAKLGWEARVRLDEGLGRAVNDFRSAGHA